MNRWVARLWREWTIESWRKIPPAFARPEPANWSDDRITAAWLGHSTVLINFFGVTILTDPALFSRVGIRVPPLFTIGPKRLVAPALNVHELPKIDIVLLSHAHFDHFDLRTLRQLSRHCGAEAVDSSAQVITAPRTSDLLRSTHFRKITELKWGDRFTASVTAGKLDGLKPSSLTSGGDGIDIIACRVNHWGARMRRDTYRGYNGYLIERNGRRILYGADTALTGSFAELRSYGPIDLAIMSIGCYNPWIRAHSTPEQAVRMANDAGAKFIMPVHHQTFRLSFEPFREPIERFKAALGSQPERIALREIGETFVLPA